MTACLSRITSILAVFGLFSSGPALARGGSQPFSVASIGLEWFGLNGSPSNAPGSETHGASIVAHLTANNLWADVMVFEEVVDVALLQTQVVGDRYRCSTYQNPDPKHQHIVLCVRDGFRLEPASDDTDLALEDVAMGTLRPALHGTIKATDGTPLAHIVALHLKAQPQSSQKRLEQTELVATYLEGIDRGTPIIVLGDLNSFADDSQRMLAIYTAHGLGLAEVRNDAKYTYRTPQHAAKFDRMFARGLDVAQSIRVAGPCNVDAADIAAVERFNAEVSEHCPIVASFQVPIGD